MTSSDSCSSNLERGSKLSYMDFTRNHNLELSTPNKNDINILYLEPLNGISNVFQLERRFKNDCNK